MTTLPDHYWDGPHDCSLTKHLECSRSEKLARNQKPTRTPVPTAVDFFEPGTTYRRGRWLFQCLAVAPRPINQEPRAVGFLYRPTEPDTTTGLDLADWEHGEWKPAPECPHCAAPADASGCHIPQHDPRCPTHDPHF